jgi:hypothetical protein
MTGNDGNPLVLLLKDEEKVGRENEAQPALGRKSFSVAAAFRLR